jgi:hypothetical protein
MSRATTLSLLLTAACGGTRPIAVQVAVPDLAGRETPLPGVVVTALPYDRDSILAALEQRATEPRPHTRTLDSLFQAFRVPFLDFAQTAWNAEQARRLRDSLVRLRQSAASAAAQGELDARLHATVDSVRRLEAELERRRAVLSAARDTLWPRIERLRSDVERWELTTFAGFDSIVRGITRGRFGNGLADTTDAGGWVTLILPPGRWWVSTRSPDPKDPNAQWYWNLPAVADTLRLTPATARHLSRY